MNYTGWLYIAWLPGYLQAQQGLSLARTGWVAAIPFLAAAVGMWVNGLVVDALARRGYDQAKTRKTAIVIGLVLSALGTLLVVQSSTPAQAVAFISMALFCVHFAGTSAWGLVQVMVAEHKVASVAAIQNFGSFVFASFAPIVTGWVVDTTHSFNLALVIAAGVTFAGALCYFFIVKTRIDYQRSAIRQQQARRDARPPCSSPPVTCAILSLRRLQPRAPCFIRRDLLVW